MNKKIIMWGLPIMALFAISSCRNDDDETPNNVQPIPVVNEDKSPVSESGKIGPYSYVDLGLPSGLKWATYNVGAKKATEYGDYFAWAETVAKKEFSNANYKWYDSETNDYTKYVTLKYDSLLVAEDDAASVNWGETWRMPTDAELKELKEGCTWEVISDFDGKGVSGDLGTSIKNGNTIFIPFAGICETGVGLQRKDIVGYYLSSSRSATYAGYACSYRFFLENMNISKYEDSRYYGYSVRAVSK